MNLKKLLEQRAAAKAEYDALAKKVEANGFKYEEGEKEKMQAQGKRIAELDEMIADAQAMAAQESNSPAATFGVHGAAGASDNSTEPQTKLDRDVRDSRGNVDSDKVTALLNALRSRAIADPSRVVSANGPFRTLGEQLQAIVKAGKKNGRVDERLLKIGAANGASEGVDSDGGFLVQNDFMQPMLDNIIAAGQIAALCTRLSTTAPGVTIPRLKENSRADGSRYGGVRAYWTGEADQIPTSKPQFERLNIQANKLAALIPVTEELMQDATFFAGWVNALGTAELSFKVDDAIINGTGNGMPLGILQSPSLVSVAKESGQAADTIVTQNIYNMYGRVLPRSKRNMRWLGNQELFPQVLALKDDSDRNIFLTGGSIAGQPDERLLGRAYVEMEQCAAPGDVGDLIAADLSQYLLIDRGGVQTDVSIHFYFDTAEDALRMMLRMGGAPLPSAPMTPYKGTKTLSPFVALQAR